MSCSCSSEEPQARNSKLTGHVEQEGGKGRGGRFDKRRKDARGERGGEERMECGWEWLKLIMQMYETQAMGNKIITLLFQAPRYFIFLHVLEVSQALLHVWACLFISTRFISSLWMSKEIWPLLLVTFSDSARSQYYKLFFYCNWKKGKFEVNVDITLKGFCEVAK